MYDFISDDSTDTVFNFVELAKKYLSKNFKENALSIIEKAYGLVHSEKIYYKKNIFLESFLDRLVFEVKLKFVNYNEVISYYFKLEKILICLI